MFFYCFCLSTTCVIGSNMHHYYIWVHKGFIFHQIPFNSFLDVFYFSSWFTYLLYFAFVYFEIPHDGISHKKYWCDCFIHQDVVFFFYLLFLLISSNLFPSISSLYSSSTFPSSISVYPAFSLLSSSRYQSASAVPFFLCLLFDTLFHAAHLVLVNCLHLAPLAFKVLGLK